MQVTPHVHIIHLPFTIAVDTDMVIERSVNVFLITGQTLTLIDTGVAGCEKEIFAYIHSIGRDPAEITRVLLTHSHPDHIGAVKAIRKETGCCVAAHPAERAWIENVNLQCRERPVPGFHALVGGAVTLDRTLEDGEVLAIEGDHDLDLVVLHTPGHSAGSVSLLLRSEGVLFSGDAVPAPGGIPVYDDVLASVESIKRLARIDGLRILLSAWDDPQEGILAYQRMREAITYLQKVHTTVLRAAAESPSPPDPMILCRQTVAALGLPPQAATPLLARTFSAHLQISGRPRLLVDEDQDTPSQRPVPETSSDRKLLT